LSFLRLRPVAAACYDKADLLVQADIPRGGCGRSFKYNRVKTALILDRPATRKHWPAQLNPLRECLERIPQACPHELVAEARSSRDTGALAQHVSLGRVPITRRDYVAMRAARLVNQAVADTSCPLGGVQDFMLANDAFTVAVNVPVTLGASDVAAFAARGLYLPLSLSHGEVIPAFIDILQIRCGLIHVLTLVPGARDVTPIEPLTIQALALSSLIGVRLERFRCAWFDDEDYFEFKPRAAVQKKPPR
jgi:hypothetical protein